MQVRAWVPGLLMLGLAAGCSKAPTPEAVKPAKVEESKAETKADAVPPLSDEDKRLIAADPATLTPEERRQRGYALRRKVMQNPDSPAARTLNDLAKAAKEGQLNPGEGVILHQPGAKPQSGAPPAGYRPPDQETKSTP